MFAELVTAADRAALAHLGGEPVIYRPAVGAPVPVTGIFDERYVIAKADAQTGTEVLGPAVFLIIADLPVDPEIDEPTLTIRGLAYHVTARPTDGAGGIMLHLRLVA